MNKDLNSLSKCQLVIRDAYESILKNEWGYSYGSIDKECLMCGCQEWQDHKENCVVLKAKEFLKELK